MSIYFSVCCVVRLIFDSDAFCDGPWSAHRAHCAHAHSRARYYSAMCSTRASAAQCALTGWGTTYIHGEAH